MDTYSLKHDEYIYQKFKGAIAHRVCTIEQKVLTAWVKRSHIKLKKDQLHFGRGKSHEFTVLDLAKIVLIKKLQKAGLKLDAASSKVYAEEGSIEGLLIHSFITVRDYLIDCHELKIDPILSLMMISSAAENLSFGHPTPPDPVYLSIFEDGGKLRITKLLRQEDFSRLYYLLKSKSDCYIINLNEIVSEVIDGLNKIVD
jgi:hypothetical protein